jgi:hypothetical protein
MINLFLIHGLRVIPCSEPPRRKKQCEFNLLPNNDGQGRRSRCYIQGYFLANIYYSILILFQKRPKKGYSDFSTNEMQQDAGVIQSQMQIDASICHILAADICGHFASDAVNHAFVYRLGNSENIRKTRSAIG